MSGGDSRFATVSAARASFFYGAPIAAALTLHGAFNLIDLLVVGRIGRPGLVAGVNLASILVTATFLLYDGICNAAVARISHARGANDDPTMTRYARALLGIGVIAALLTCLPFYPFAASVIEGYSFSTPEAASGAAAYLRIMCFGSSTMFLLLALTAVLRGQGRVRAPVVLLVAANVLNLALDLVLVFGWFGFPRLEERGAAYATVIARTALALPALWLVRGVYVAVAGQARGFAFAARRLFAEGLPTALQLVVRIVSFLVVLRFAGSAAGEGASALSDGVNVAQRIEMTAVFAMLGFGAAATALVGAAIGAGMPHRARAAGWWTVFHAVVVSSVFAGAAWVFRMELFRLVEPALDPVAASAASEYWSRILPSLPVMAVGAVLSRALNGTLDVRTPLVVDVVVYLLLLPLACFGALQCGAAPVRIWDLLFLSHAVGGAALAVAFAKRPLQRIDPAGAKALP